MFDVMKFWLDHGVAGFRLDAIPTLFEDKQLRNEPEKGRVECTGRSQSQEYLRGQLPEVHGVIRRMRTMIEKYPGELVLIKLPKA